MQMFVFRIEIGAPRNTALSTNQTDGSEENMAHFEDREVLIARAVLRQSDFGPKSRGGNSIIADCSCMSGTGFNGGALCSFNRMRKYRQYLRSSYHLMPKFEKTVEKRTIFVFFWGISGREVRIVRLFG